jgi:hypothetical protein
MGSLTQPTPLGVALAVCALLVAGLLIAATVVRRRRRDGRQQRERLDAELARSRAQIHALSERVEELAGELVDARRAAQEVTRSDRGYVITSIGNADPSVALPARPVGEVVEEQLVEALARRRNGSPLRGRSVDAVVRAVALGHGVRRALSPDVLDRAAAEANVARRRSRRERKREVREARRLLRAVRTRRGAGEDAA